MRLIDADEAIINFGFEWDDIPPTREEFVRFLKKQPTVDAVEVVRCRECKYWGDEAGKLQHSDGVLFAVVQPQHNDCRSSTKQF